MSAMDTQQGSDDWYFSFSPNHNIALRIAVDRGLVLALHRLISQTDVYRSLLEEHISGQAEGRRYVERMQQCLTESLTWLDTANQCLQSPTPATVDTVDGTLLVKGAVERCQRLVKDKCDLERRPQDNEICVRGGTFELQECMMQGLFCSVYCLFPGVTKLLIEATTTKIDSSEFELYKSDRPGGEYMEVKIQRADTESTNKTQQPFLEAITGGKHFCKSTESMNLLEFYGLLLQQGGEAFCKTEGYKLSALVMLIPMAKTFEEIDVSGPIDEEELKGDETILIVDDEDMIWEVLIDSLQNLGYTVILAADGNEALEIYRENKDEIDLTILDMVMPGLDGHTAFFELQRIDPEVKVLLHSAYVSEEDVRDVLDAGAVGFLQKPYRMTDLATKIRHVFAAGLTSP